MAATFQITPDDVLLALRESTADGDDACLMEQEDGQFIVDSKFDIPKLAAVLTRLGHKSA